MTEVCGPRHHFSADLLKASNPNQVQTVSSPAYPCTCTHKHPFFFKVTWYSQKKVTSTFKWLVFRVTWKPSAFQLRFHPAFWSAENKQCTILCVGLFFKSSYIGRGRQGEKHLPFLFMYFSCYCPHLNFLFLLTRTQNYWSLAVPNPSGLPT